MDAQAAAQRHESLTSSAIRAFGRHRSGMVGLTITVVLFVIAVLAPVLAPYDPLEMHTADKLTGPSATYLLGTDEFGRDILSRVLYGGRIAFQVGVISIAIATVLGVTIGLIAGYESAWFDTVTMRFFDALLAFPAILLGDRHSGRVGSGHLQRHAGRRHCQHTDFRAPGARQRAVREEQGLCAGRARDRRALESHPVSHHPAQHVGHHYRAGDGLLCRGRACWNRRSASWGWACRCRPRRGARC